MGVTAENAAPAIAANAGMTEAQGDASRMAFDQQDVNEAKANLMILLPLEQKDVIVIPS